MTTLSAEKLSLREVHRLLGLREDPMTTYTAQLALAPLDAAEQQELAQITQDFKNYLGESKLSEGLVKVLTTYPLLRLAGFYRYPVELQLEEAIERITIEDEETLITGRFDILAINRAAELDGYPFWVLIIEAKNSTVAVNAGIPQLLTYAYGSLSHQSCVWGLVTNGLDYQFLRLHRGAPPTYQLFPTLHLLESDRAIQLLQVLKALAILNRTALAATTTLGYS